MIMAQLMNSIGWSSVLQCYYLFQVNHPLESGYIHKCTQLLATPMSILLLIVSGFGDTIGDHCDSASH